MLCQIVICAEVVVIILMMIINYKLADSLKRSQDLIKSYAEYTDRISEQLFMNQKKEKLFVRREKNKTQK